MEMQLRCARGERGVNGGSMKAMLEELTCDYEIMTDFLEEEVPRPIETILEVALGPLKELDKVTLKSCAEYIKIFTTLGEADDMKDQNHLFHNHMIGEASLTQEQNYSS